MTARTPLTPEAFGALCQRGIESIDDALAMAGGIVDDPDGDPSLLLVYGCDVLARLRDAVAPVLPPDLAAIGARAAAARDGITAAERSFGVNTVAVQRSTKAVCESAADVPALFASLAAERTLREAAEARADALAGAVREEREAYHDRFDAETDPRVTPAQQRVYGERYEQATDATDALLSDAPAPAVVPADVVRRYLAAEETMRLVAADDHRRDTYHEWAKRHGAAMDAVDAARTALDAALGAP